MSLSERNVQNTLTYWQLLCLNKPYDILIQAWKGILNQVLFLGVFTPRTLNRQRGKKNILTTHIGSQIKRRRRRIEFERSGKSLSKVFDGNPVLKKTFFVSIFFSSQLYLDNFKSKEFYLILFRRVAKNCDG